MAPIVEEGTGGEIAGEGNETLIYWVSWLATVSTLGLFSSGVYVLLDGRGANFTDDVMQIVFGFSPQFDELEDS